MLATRACSDRLTGSFRSTCRPFLFSLTAVFPGDSAATPLRESRPRTNCCDRGCSHRARYPAPHLWTRAWSAPAAVLQLPAPLHPCMPIPSDSPTRRRFDVYLACFQLERGAHCSMTSSECVVVRKTPWVVVAPDGIKPVRSTVSASQCAHGRHCESARPHVTASPERYAQCPRG